MPKEEVDDTSLQRGLSSQCAAKLGGIVGVEMIVHINDSRAAKSMKVKSENCVLEMGSLVVGYKLGGRRGSMRWIWICQRMDRKVH